SRPSMARHGRTSFGSPSHVMFENSEAAPGWTSGRQNRGSGMEKRVSASRMLVVSMAFAASGSCARQVAPTPVLLPPVPVAVAGVVSTPNREPLLATVRLSFTDRQLAKVLTDKTG